MKLTIKDYTYNLTSPTITKLNITERGPMGIGVIPGGDENYVLTKNSTKDFDFKWVGPTESGVVTWGNIVGDLKEQTDLEPLFKPSFINKKAEDPHYSGFVSSGTINSLVDTNANWQTDEWKNKAVKIYKNGSNDFEFALIENNTSNTLVFDDDLIFTPCGLCSYTIIDTLELSYTTNPQLIAISLDGNDVAVVLPKVDNNNERSSFTIYIETSSDGINICPIIGRGKDYQLGAKYGTLQYNGEGVTLYSHNWDVGSSLEFPIIRPHWDIVNSQGIQRFASGYWDGDEYIEGDTFQPYGSELVFTIDKVRRFVPVVRNGIKYLRFTSLIDRAFMAEFICSVEKTGGVGDIEISMGKLHSDTQELEILDKRVSRSRFGSGTGFQTISVKSPVILSRNDEIVVVARIIGGGTFSINTGSSLDIIQI